MKEQLSPAEWEAIVALPADGQTYRVDGIAFRAKHLPATKMKTEQVIAECRLGTVRRQFVRGKWQATEFISSY